MFTINPRRAPLSALLTFALGATCALAQQNQAPAEAPKTARIEGTVISSTGDPVARAQLRLQGSRGQIAALVDTLANLTPAQGGRGGAAPPAAAAKPAAPTSYSATTDAAGKFVIDLIDPAPDYRLTAQRQGFNNSSYGARPNAPAASIALSAGQVLKGLVITMIPQSVISGKITDANGDLVQGAQVSVMRRTYQRGVRTLSSTNSGTTNDQGEYRIAGVTPGRYYVSANDRSSTAALLAGLQGGAAQTEKGPANLTTYYPASIDVPGATPLDVTPGAELRRIDIQFRTGKTFSIRGRAIIVATGAPATDASVSAMLKEESGSPLAAAQAMTAQLLSSIGQARRTDGSFELRGLTPGTYFLVNQPSTQSILAAAAPGGKAPPKLVGSMELTLGDHDVDGIVLSLTSGATITGTAKLDGGDIKSMFSASNTATDPDSQLMAALAASGTTVPALAGYGRFNLMLAPIRIATNTARGALQENGTFTVPEIAPDQYMVNLNLPDGYFIKSMTYGGTDLIHNPLDLTSGSGGTMQLMLSNKAGTMTGTVTNDKGEPQNNVNVTLWSAVPEAGTTSNGIHSAFTDSTGNFQFKNLAPGDYRVAAWEEIDQTLAQVREFLGQFDGSAEKLKVAESGSVTSNLKVISVDKIKAAEAKLP